MAPRDSHLLVFPSLWNSLRQCTWVGLCDQKDLAEVNSKIRLLKDDVASVLLFFLLDPLFWWKPLALLSSPMSWGSEVWQQELGWTILRADHPAPVKPWDGCSPNWHLYISWETLSSNYHTAKPVQISDPCKLWDNKCLLF